MLSYLILTKNEKRIRLEHVLDTLHHTIKRDRNDNELINTEYQLKTKPVCQKAFEILVCTHKSSLYKYRKSTLFNTEIDQEGNEKNKRKEYFTLSNECTSLPVGNHIHNYSTKTKNIIKFLYGYLRQHDNFIVPTHRMESFYLTINNVYSKNQGWRDYF